MLKQISSSGTSAVGSGWRVRKGAAIAGLTGVRPSRLNFSASPLRALKTWLQLTSRLFA